MSGNIQSSARVRASSGLRLPWLDAPRISRAADSTDYIAGQVLDVVRGQVQGLTGHRPRSALRTIALSATWHAVGSLSRDDLSGVAATGWRASSGAFLPSGGAVASPAFLVARGLSSRISPLADGPATRARLSAYGARHRCRAARRPRPEPTVIPPCGLSRVAHPTFWSTKRPVSEFPPTELSAFSAGTRASPEFFRSHVL